MAKKQEIKGGWVAFPGTKIKVAVAVEAGALEKMGMEWDVYQYLANVHFKHKDAFFCVFNVRICGDFGYAQNKAGNWVLIIELNNKNIHKIEKIQDIGKDFNDDNIICLN
jgi:hypothetical protein